MLKNTVLLIIIVLSSQLLLAQDKYTLSGHVKDASSGEELIGATIYIEELKSGGVTNVYGFYSLTFEGFDQKIGEYFMAVANSQVEHAQIKYQENLKLYLKYHAIK